MQLSKAECAWVAVDLWAPLIASRFPFRISCPRPRRCRSKRSLGFVKWTDIWGIYGGPGGVVCQLITVTPAAVSLSQAITGIECCPNLQQLTLILQGFRVKRPTNNLWRCFQAPITSSSIFFSKFGLNCALVSKAIPPELVRTDSLGTFVFAANASPSKRSQNSQIQDIASRVQRKIDGFHKDNAWYVAGRWQAVPQRRLMAVLTMFYCGECDTANLRSTCGPWIIRNTLDVSKTNRPSFHYLFIDKSASFFRKMQRQKDCCSFKRTNAIFFYSWCKIKCSLLQKPNRLSWPFVLDICQQKKMFIEVKNFEIILPDRTDQ